MLSIFYFGDLQLPFSWCIIALVLIVFVVVAAGTAVVGILVLLLIWLSVCCAVTLSVQS